MTVIPSYNPETKLKLPRAVVQLDRVLYSGLALGHEEEAWAFRNAQSPVRYQVSLHDFKCIVQRCISLANSSQSRTTSVLPAENLFLSVLQLTTANLLVPCSSRLRRSVSYGLWEGNRRADKEIPFSPLYSRAHRLRQTC